MAKIRRCGVVFIHAQCDQADQFYRLLDQTNYKKSVGQLLALLHGLDCDVDVVVRKRLRKTA